MIRSYHPAIVFVLLGAGVGGVIARVIAMLNGILGPRRKIDAKNDPCECGLPSNVQKGFRFGISFYLVAMLFILFDIEVLFLYPVAIQLDSFGMLALIETVVFVGLLFVAFIYVRRRGALEWK